MSQIVIEKVGEDAYEARRDMRVPLVPAPTNLDHLKQVIQDKRLPNDRVLMTEDDGYLVDITREFSRLRRSR